MAKVYEFLANGFEEIEGLAPVDILRRGGVDIKTVSVTGSEFVETSHGVTIKADLRFEDVESFEDADMLMIPGGMPGSTNLNEHEGVRQALIAQHKAGKQEDFCLGNVYEGVKKTETVNEFKKCNVYSKKECSQCFARFYCSGGCAANSYNFTGKINDVYEIGCKMQQKRIECALMIKAALAED